jgi:hypothetical protein
LTGALIGSPGLTSGSKIRSTWRFFFLLANCFLVFLAVC